MFVLHIISGPKISAGHRIARILEAEVRCRLGSSRKSLRTAFVVNADTTLKYGFVVCESYIATRSLSGI